MITPVSEFRNILVIFLFSAIEKHEGNKEYGKQALLDTGEMRAN